ncbi:MAG: septal ring lytic transglycosylase RlpA family protein [Parvularculaceae bacterium]
MALLCQTRTFLAIIMLAGFAAACSSTRLPSAPKQISRALDGPVASPHFKVGQPYQVAGIWYYPKANQQYNKVGTASWYGAKFHNKLTANGEVFDMEQMTAAHPTLPMPSTVRVTNLENGRSVVVRLNDRGPFAHDRVIDMSKAAAEQLGFASKGLARVRVEYIGEASLSDAITSVGQGGSSPYAVQQEATQIYASAAPVDPSFDTVKTRIVSGPELIISSDTEAQYAPPANYQIPAYPQTNVPVPVTTASVSSLPQVSAHADPTFVGRDSYMVQVGAFSSAANAHRAADRFGYNTPVRIAQMQTPGGGFLYRVRLGPFTSVPMAENTLRAAKGQGFLDARIVTP